MIFKDFALFSVICALQILHSMLKTCMLKTCIACYTKLVVFTLMGKAEMSVHCPSFENAWYRGATVTDVVLYPSGVLGQKKD